MAWRTSLLVLALTALLFPHPAAAQACPALPDHLEGELTFRGDAWQLRLRPAPTPESGAISGAELDLPDLLMSGRSALLRCDDGRAVLTLPFGLGEVALGARADGSFRGAARLGHDSVRVSLRPGAPPPYETREVVFRNGAVDLAGTAFLPHGPGPKAGVVVVHGSGPQGRERLEYRSWGDFFARLGVAALVYDKRGVGGSAGDFEADSGFVELTGDALAAVRFLGSLSEVDPGRVGISGSSQAGWIGYRAARDPSVSFLALLVPPSVSVAEQEVQRVRGQLRAAGFDDQAVQRAVAHTRLMLAVATTGLGWSELAQSVRRIGGEAWAEHVQRPAAPDDLGWWRRHAAVDPQADIEALRVPTFAAFSAADPVVPALQNAGVLRDLAARRPGADITVVTAERGDHRLEVPAGPDATGRWQLPRLDPGVVAALRRWFEWRWSDAAAHPAEAVQSQRVLRWDEDLTYMVRELEARHADRSWRRAFAIDRQYSHSRDKVLELTR